MKIVQKCSNITGTNELIEYLKTENATTLLNCSPPNFGPDFFLTWVPVIESNNTKDAFLTKTPEEIYMDPNEDAPAMDAMFSFTSQVFQFYSTLKSYQSELNISVVAGGDVYFIEYKFL